MMGPYLPSAYLARSYLAGLWVADGAPQAAPAPVLFTDQLAAYVLERTGIAMTPDKLPTRLAEYPLVSYTVVGGDPVMRLGGVSGLSWTSIQIDCWSPISFDSAAVAARVRATFSGLRRAMMGSVFVSNCVVGNPRSRYFAAANLSDDGVYRTSLDLKFWYVG